MNSHVITLSTQLTSSEACAVCYRSRCLLVKDLTGFLSFIYVRFLTIALTFHILHIKMTLTKFASPPQSPKVVYFSDRISGSCIE